MTKANFTNFSKEDDLKWKMTWNGRRPQVEDDLKWKTTQKWNISAITGKIIRQITKVSNKDKHIWKMTSNGILPQISKVKYLSNYWPDLRQILDLGLYDQSKLYKF